MPTPHLYGFQPNPDDYRCLPSCFVMAYEAQTGRRLSMDEAEGLTGYVAGRATWSYAAMLALANADLNVTQIEATSPDAFVNDPIVEVQRLYGAAEAERWVLRHDALAVEVDLVKRCLQHGGVRFDVREPTLNDLRVALAHGASVVVSLNHNRLVGSDGYTPHFVIVSDLQDQEIILDNPGPPAVEHQVVSIERFIDAWHSPSHETSNALIVSHRT